MPHVANNSNFELLDTCLAIGEALAQGQEIEERLGGMLVHPIPRIHDRCARKVTRQKIGCAAFFMTNDDHIRTHRFEGASRVEEGLTLGD
jgi:hypothetical protein